MWLLSAPQAFLSMPLPLVIAKVIANFLLSRNFTALFISNKSHLKSFSESREHGGERFFIQSIRFCHLKIVNFVKF